MMKVLLICTNADLAGAPIHVETLVLGLMQKVEFFVIFGDTGPVYDRLFNSGIQVAVIPQLKSKISPYLDFVSLVKILIHIKRFKPELLHAHSSKAGMLTRIASLLTATPCIYTVHGWGWRGLGRVGSLMVLWIERILLKIPYFKFIYVAKDVEQDAHITLKAPISKGRVIYNGARNIGIKKSNNLDVFRILMLARVSSAKDHETLARAFNTLDFNSKLILCGGGTTDPNFLENLKIWAPLAYSKIEVLGERSDIANLLHMCDVFTLISNFEALPMSIIEAMSAGLPIIATNVGGVSELISDGYNGILVSQGDIDQLQKSFHRILNREFSDRIGKHARLSYDNNFNSEIMLSKTYDFYCELASGSKIDI